jgi:hypothetical protein
VNDVEAEYLNFSRKSVDLNFCHGDSIGEGRKWPAGAELGIPPEIGGAVITGLDEVDTFAPRHLLPPR